MDDRAGTGAAPASEERALADQVRRLTELVEHQQRRLAALEAGPFEPPPSPGAPTPAPLPSVAAGPAGELHDRRALLRRVGVAAAGAVTGGVALAAGTADPAAAANGDPLTIGSSSNAGAASTVHTWTGAAIGDTGPAVVLVKDANVGVANTIGATVLAYRTGGGADGKALAGIDTGDGIGVYGKGDTGVHALGANGGVGLRAVGGYAVTASTPVTGGVGVAVDAPTTHLLLSPVAADPYLVGGGTRLAGSVVSDTNTNLWFCTAGGTPGTWRKLAGPGTVGALHLLPVPVRVFDSRAGFAPANVAKGAFTNQTKVIDAKNNASGVPIGATAVLVNLAVTNTNAGGYGTLWASGLADPGTASVNWGQAASTVSNLAVTAVGGVSTFNCKIAGTADVIVDVVGYFR